MSDGRFFMAWILAFLGFPLGGLLSVLVVGSVVGVPTAALAGALTGAVIGAAQFLVLRRRMGVGPGWILATAIGLAVGDALGTALTDAGTGAVDLIVSGAAAGAVVGISQWLLLRRHVAGAIPWPPVVAAAWTIGWTVTWAVGVDVERGYAVFGASGALVFALITGTAMLLLVRRCPTIIEAPSNGKRKQMSENEGSRAADELHVVFGTGPVGLAVADELSKRGRRVRVVNRSGRAAAPAGVEVVGGDATDWDFAREASAGAEVVYFALNPPYHRWPELFSALQDGVVEGAARAGAKLVAMENIYMYGPTGGRPLTEDLPHAARTRKGAVRARMSRDLFAAHEAGKVRAMAGRASDFFGPRVTDSAAGETIFGRAVAGKAAQVAGNPDLPHTYTYVPDIGKGLVILGEREEALGRAWHLPSPETVSTRRFAQLVFEAAGGGLKMQRAPKVLFRALGLFDPAMREMVEMLYEFEEPFIVDHSAFTEAFGDHATPLDEAIRETVGWYRVPGR